MFASSSQIYGWSVHCKFTVILQRKKNPIKILKHSDFNESNSHSKCWFDKLKIHHKKQLKENLKFFSPQNKFEFIVTVTLIQTWILSIFFHSHWPLINIRPVSNLWQKVFVCFTKHAKNSQNAMQERAEGRKIPKNCNNLFGKQKLNSLTCKSMFLSLSALSASLSLSMCLAKQSDVSSFGAAEIKILY